MPRDQPVKDAAAGDDGGRNQRLNRALQHHIHQRPPGDAKEDQRRDGVKRDAKGAGQLGLSPAQDEQSQYRGEGIERHRCAGEHQDLLKGSRPEKRQCRA